jgi:uncharacterized membrane protein YciS (DUF1049 family)
MMDGDIVFTALPFAVVIVLGAGFWLAIREHPGTRRRRLRRRDRRMNPKTNGHSHRGPGV